ncbi:MAG TPA: UbiA family prenyltransferase [Streptosporangiaceae bacterium]|nr:UbiA family prenyltransferase [Streptosporangiaceae bacterium]
MTTTAQTTAQRTAQPGAAARPNRLSSYARLANLYFYDYYLCVLVVWALLAESVRLDGRTLATMALVVLGWVGVVAATVTFDDVTGYRDGSDDRNYSPDQAVLRNRANKPLITGELSLAQALRFGYAAMAAGALLWGAAIAVAPHRPLWAAPVAAFVLLISVQYSYGLKISYHRGQELVLLLSPGLMVLVPFGLLAGEVTGLIVAESYLFGLWSLLVSLYSNLNDLDGDTAAGRRNLATTCRPETYRKVVAAISATEIVAILAAPAFGAVSWWFVAFLIPVMVIRARQLWHGLGRGEFLAARKLGINAHRIGTIALIIANLALTH